MKVLFFIELLLCVIIIYIHAQYCLFLSFAESLLYLRLLPKIFASLLFAKAMLLDKILFTTLSTSVVKFLVYGLIYS